MELFWRVFRVFKILKFCYRDQMELEFSGGVSSGNEPRVVVGRTSPFLLCCPPESQGTPRPREIVLEGSYAPARQG